MTLYELPYYTNITRYINERELKIFALIKTPLISCRRKFNIRY